ncbi:tetrathionate reductase family octaheme c-type cytochrome [Roseospira goensis]|uniref:Octaheme c-type cytochrome (Tetrathionate reductase family) n=1 Tax=Roseospira goensis TaxID=391922 RepID=A0A7W6RY13_9PROT|nr:tetrathionate reductase family octaheme c-type cytochrome [Roseospira goensis]MBB4285318.1 octaheme c-type cytochrome (tetrathionate reductase family) [Roseospira goensis]
MNGTVRLPPGTLTSRAARALICCILAAVLVWATTAPAPAQAGSAAAQGAITGTSRIEVAPDSTADHTTFEELQGPFDSGPAVTAACLECHVNAADQLHRTTHWTWAFDNALTGQTDLGKRNVVNNFCVATATNWPRCTSCHIGYGWKDDGFDLTQDTAVDCLVCHDTTGTYKKFPTGAGHPAYEDTTWQGKPWPAVDLARVAQAVGRTSRETCGACHFYGGGGDGVKHGDLDSSMADPDFSLDVHMDRDGLDFRCSTCHTTGSHQVTGSRYTTTAVDRIGIDVPGHTDDTRATCESCHGMAAHDDHPKLNEHTDRVACTTCHVPAFARGGPKTKMWWDWSTAGQFNDAGKPYVVKGEDGYPLYVSKKGTFEWAADVTPEYRWFNGIVRYTQRGETIDPSGVVPINAIEGSAADPDARIWPFKIMRGRQPYDSGHNVLALPHLFGKDEAAFWKSFDWDKALRGGMQAETVSFSGSYGFVETEYAWPILHMVAPKEDAVGCNECHTVGGRLAGLTDFYMPGRDTFPWLTAVGWGAAGLTLLGVLGHGLARLIAAARKRRTAA